MLLPMDLTPRRASLPWALAALTFITALAYLRPLFLGDTFGVRDQLPLVLPNRAYLADALASGRVPEWCDRISLGTQFAADSNNAVTYPLAWILALLPRDSGSDLLLIAHVLLAGLGAFGLARRLGAEPVPAVAAGTIFMLSGYTGSMLVNGNPLFTLAWTPFVVVAADLLADAKGTRETVRGGALFAAALAMAIMSGNPSGFVIAGLLSTLWGVVRAPPGTRLRVLGTLLIASVAAAPLAAIAVLPAQALLADSERQAGFDLSLAMLWSTHPLRLLEWFWPFALGHGLRTDHNLALLYAYAGYSNDNTIWEPSWAASLYVGLPTLVLASAARRHRGLLCLSGLFVLLALGRFTPAYTLFRVIFMPEQFLRYPEKHAVASTLIWAVLSGVSMTRMLAAPPSPRLIRNGLVGLGGMALLVVATWLAIPWLVRFIEQHPGTRQTAFDARGALDFVVAGGATGGGGAALVWLSLWTRGRQRWQRLAAPLALVGVTAPLVVHTWLLLPVVPRARLAGVPEILRPIAALGKPGQPPERVFRQGGTTTPGTITPQRRTDVIFDTAAGNTSMSFGFAALPGFNPARTERLRMFVAATAPAPVDRMLALTGVRFAIVPAHQVAAVGLQVLGGPVATYHLVENAGRRPRAFFAPRWRWMPDETAVYKDLLAVSTDVGLVRFAGQGEPSPAGDAGLMECAIDAARPERVRIECEAETSGYVVFLSELTAGWSASLDGAPAAIERADLLFPAVRVSAGRHRVELVYRTPGLRPGAAVSGLSWLLCAALLVWTRRARGCASEPAVG